MFGAHEMHTALIVDDEERLRRALARSLAHQSRRTLTAASGEEALRLLKEEEIDLVITDLVMPGMDGMTLVRNIKDLAPSIKTIIITAYGSAGSVREAEELGVACYLAKPFDLSHLKSKVNELLAGEALPGGESSYSGGGRALCPVSLTRRRALEGAVDLSRKALSYIRPRNVMPALGRAARAASRLTEADRALRSICLAGGRTVRAAGGLSRKALPCISPRNVMLALGRMTRAISGLPSALTKTEVKGR